jgi:hypothetical protein
MAKGFNSTDEYSRFLRMNQDGQPSMKDGTPEIVDYGRPKTVATIMKWGNGQPKLIPIVDDHEPLMDNEILTGETSVVISSSKRRAVNRQEKRTLTDEEHRVKKIGRLSMFQIVQLIDMMNERIGLMENYIRTAVAPAVEKPWLPETIWNGKLPNEENWNQIGTSEEVPEWEQTGTTIKENLHDDAAPTST